MILSAAARTGDTRRTVRDADNGATAGCQVGVSQDPRERRL